MSVNIKGDPLSDSQIAAHTLELRRYHGLGDLEVANVVALLGRGAILTRFGEKKFEHQIVDDLMLGGDEAVTLISNDCIRVRISRSIYERVQEQDRRARMTVAHEFMHGVLHQKDVPLARARLQTGTRFIAPFVSVERQANVGASAYLITDAMVKRANSSSELADIARVSHQAGDIRWELEQNRAARGRIGQGLRALQTELAEASRTSAIVSNAMVCPMCGDRSLLPIGVRYLCIGACDRTIDGFADGDSPQH